MLNTFFNFIALHLRDIGSFSQNRDEFKQFFSDVSFELHLIVSIK